MFCKSFLIIILLILTHLSAISQVDEKATRETKNLYSKLKILANKGTMVGHQDDLAYGLNEDKTRWKGEAGRSDILAVSGQYPAVFGWDLGKIEFDSLRELDGVPFNKIREYIKFAYSKGCISTFSWHLNNPTDPKKTSWDKMEGTVNKILTEAEYKKVYNSWLDKVIEFFKSLKTDSGTPIPIIFRPFHEHTGNWFWWGSGQCTVEEYKKIWKYTEDYFIKNGVHNLLYAYSTDAFKSKEHYLERYPGDDYIDILGFDTYHRGEPESNQEFIKSTKIMVETVGTLAKEKNKISAITETGLEKITVEKWWTEILLPIVKDANLSYILMWRNGRPDHFYVPFKGQLSAEDFMKFSNNQKIILQKQLISEKIYNSH